MQAIRSSLINHQFAVCAFLTITSLTGTLAADYYVSPQGKDSNTGTETHPWLTIAKAADTLKAGDTVYIRGGTYAPQTPITPKNSGTPDKPITYRAYPEEVVTIDGQNVSLSRWYDVSYRIVFYSLQYIHLVCLS